jgi:hypothetical protein
MRHAHFPTPQGFSQKCQQSVYTRVVCDMWCVTQLDHAQVIHELQKHLEALCACLADLQPVGEMSHEALVQARACSARHSGDLLDAMELEKNALVGNPE